MRFMIIVKASKDSEAGVMPEEELLATMATYHEELQCASGSCYSNVPAHARVDRYFRRDRESGQQHLATIVATEITKPLALGESNE